ncbi:phage antirepressor N-terminal domain-containing protein [Streptomyces sp. LKA04]|uniref:phage antirepressor N-terminal domain-containing protein n=1 Tax=Streptomyces sp. LKA04 TaxID=3398092 RepID=UPI003A80B658
MTRTLVDSPDPNEPKAVLGLSTFDFHGHHAAVLTNERGHWVFPGQLCNFMGIDGNAQRNRIERKHWSQGWTSMTNVQLPGDVQTREHFLLHQRRLATWLGSIDTARIKDPGTRSEVEQHQTEFADALADYLTKGVAINPRTAPEVFAQPQQAFLDHERRLEELEERQRGIEANLLTQIAGGGTRTWNWSEAIAAIRQFYGATLSVDQLCGNLRLAGVLKQGSREPKAPYQNKCFFFTGTSWEILPAALPYLYVKAMRRDAQVREELGTQLRLDYRDAPR